uniref:Glycosyltransferase family 2 protein n=1 Tax=candidate division WOR-3 bacterium TaxID=2052148 RepID=A0A7C2P2D4_UNCW3
MTGTEHGVSCFMIVKDVLSQEYPFLEAIAQALPICDEFLISDGYSTDGTYEILVEISKLNPKIKVYRDRWPPLNKLTVLKDVTNALRKRCSGKYILYVQANEVIHEQSTAIVRELPEIWPNVILFSLPYIQLAGTIKFTEEFRGRLAKNYDFIEAIGDAWTLGLSRSFLKKELLKSLLKPRKILQYLVRGMLYTYANVPSSKYTRAVSLPKPIFRYWCATLSGFYKKLKMHQEMFKDFDFELPKKPKNLLEAANILKEISLKNNLDVPQYPSQFLEVPLNEHPRIMRDLLQEGVYRIRDEIYDLIEKTF